MNLLYWLTPLCDWDRLNLRRWNLIQAMTTEGQRLTDEERAEFDSLQTMCDIWVSWESNHQQVCDIIEIEEFMNSIPGATECQTTDT